MDHTAGRCSTDVKTHHHIHPASHHLTWIVTGDNESSRISTFHRDIINRTIIRKSGHNSFRNKTPTYNNLIKTRNELWMNLEKKIYRNHIFLLTKKEQIRQHQKAKLTLFLRRQKHVVESISKNNSI